MKKLLFLFSFFSLIFLKANSQLSQGNWLVGGSGSFNSRNGSYITTTINYDAKFTEYTISPKIGYFILDKFSIGLKPTLSRIKADYFPPASGYSDESRFFIGPYVRYYLLNIDKQFNILAEGSYQFGKFKSENINGEIKNYSVFIGPVLYFNSSVGLEFLIGYSNNSENIQHLKSSIKNLQVEVGFQIHLKK